MKKILFSRSQKNHFSDTVVRVGKNNLGFSIVELIIVIAIMAILAAIAIPVFGVFIEKSKINNDKQLINDMIFAVNLSNEAGVYEEYEAMSLAAIEYPIAFIVLKREPDENGNSVEVIVSNTEVTNSTEKCVFQDVEVYYLESTPREFKCGGKIFGSPCPNKSNEEVYTLKSEIMNICTSHSKKSSQESQGYNTDIEYVHKSFGIGCSPKSKGTPVKLPANQYVTTSLSSLASNGIYENTGSAKCPKAVYGASVGTISVGPDNAGTHPVTKALIDVFGENFRSELSLSYDEWINNGGFNYSTFYSAADDLMGDIKSLSGTMQFASTYKDQLSSFGINIAQKYSTDAEVMSAIATRIVGEYETYGEWEAAWIGASKSDAPTYYPFGMDKPEYGMETYAACRRGYNSGFASYLEARGEIGYANVVKNYRAIQSNLIEGALTTFGLDDLKMPATVTPNSFYTDHINDNTHNNFLYRQLLENNGNDAEAAEKGVEDIRRYYGEYVASTAYLENCKAFYDMMKSVAATSGVAESTGDYFGYYQGYVGEISAMYDEVSKATKNGDLVIIVTVKDGKAVCTLSNSEADPRNE